MLFDEYKRASKRHEQACEVLMDNMRKYSYDKQKHILLEVYYLAGYIYECIYKYALFAFINYDPNKSVTELNQDGLSFKTHIKTHKFSVLTEELNLRTPGNIPFINYEEQIDYDIQELYYNWKPEFRYESYYAPDEEKIKQFVYWGKKTREEILKLI
jgi:hypothetical protein